MPANFPTTSTGSVPWRPAGASLIRYPASYKNQKRTRVLTFADGSEQRYRDTPSLTSWQLLLKNLVPADRDAVQAFFDSVKGSFDGTWDLALRGRTYHKMRFAEDQLIWNENQEGLFTATIRLAQGA